MRTILQKRLHDSMLGRDLATLQRKFGKYGIDLLYELESTVDKDSDIIVDIGCGYGVGVEEITRHFREKLGIDIRGIGVDLNPLPKHIPQSILHGSKPTASFHVADARELPFQDGAVAAGYSFATLQYIPDALRALEEGHRVLKPGGTFIWHVNGAYDISLFPNFRRILKHTPGGEDFDFTRNRLVVCRKPDASEFRGFPWTETFNFREAFFGVDRHRIRSIYYSNQFLKDWTLYKTNADE